jgi:hypothetical protein
LAVEVGGVMATVVVMVVRVLVAATAAEAKKTD